jgi:hypothetical protein
MPEAAGEAREAQAVGNELQAEGNERDRGLGAHVKGLI